MSKAHIHVHRMRGKENGSAIHVDKFIQYDMFVVRIDIAANSGIWTTEIEWINCGRLSNLSKYNFPKREIATVKLRWDEW